MKITYKLNNKTPYEKMVDYVKNNLIPNGFNYRYFDEYQFLAFNPVRNIVFYVGNIPCFDSKRDYFQQPVKDQRFHDIRRYNSYESCYPGTNDFPIFDNENYLSLYCPQLDDFYKGIIDISLSKIKTFTPLWNAIGEDNRNICNEISKSKIKVK